MSKIPTIEFEAMFLGWSESHNQGAKIVLQVPPEELEPFKRMTARKGKIAGQRLAVVAVEIGDDEQPVAQEPQPKARGGSFPTGLCGLAVRWSSDPQFAAFLLFLYPDAVAKCRNSDGLVDRGSAGVIRRLCAIESRKELNTNAAAAERFERMIRGPYMKYCAERGHAT